MRQSDPFGLQQAAWRATHPSRFFNLRRALGYLILTIIRICSLLPWILLLLLPIQAWKSQYVPATVAAILFWLYFLSFLVHRIRLFDNDTDACVAKNPSSDHNTVVVIGAGPSGLAVVKECLAAGLSVKAYERRSSLGGVYCFTEECSGGVWKGCRLTSSPWVTAFSDFPPLGHSDRHLTHYQYLNYLKKYADNFSLHPHLFYNRTVTHVSRSKCGKWAARVKDEERRVETLELFNYVVVCAGSNSKEKDIAFPGIETFKGQALHAANYKQPGPFKEKKVLVVGNGESAVDIAAQLAGTAKDIFLSIRRGKFVIPRIDRDSGLANDYDTNRLRYAPPVAFRNWYMMLIRRIGYWLGKHDAAGAIEVQMLERSSVGPLSQTATKTSEFIDSILSGALRVRDEVEYFEDSMVTFRDGASEKIDVVIFAHGYEISFPFLELHGGIQVPHPGRLYRRMFIPRVGKSLAFCGFVRPSIGAIPPTAELQARYFAMVASGRRYLPSEERMEELVDRQLKEGSQLFPLHKQPNTVVFWIGYMDEIASEIGCRPDVWKLICDPVLLWKVMTGPVSGAIYRMHGPGSDAAARETVLSLTRTHPLIEIIVHFGFHFWLWPIAMLHPNKVFQNQNTLI